MNLKQLRQFAGDDVAQDAMDDLALELARLNDWKESASYLLSEWDKVWDVLGRPGKLGDSKAEVSLKAVESLRVTLRSIQEMANEDLRLGEHPLRTNLHQIEADARAALGGVVSDALTPPA